MELFWKYESEAHLVIYAKYKLEISKWSYTGSMGARPLQ
jgi:hypothetical protein